MRIQSRKHPEKTEEVTVEQWNKMKFNGIAHNWKIIDNSDIAEAAKQNIDIKVVEFAEVSDPDEQEREDIMKQLDELGVSYRKNTGLNKLREKLEIAKEEAQADLEDENTDHE